MRPTLVSSSGSRKQPISPTRNRGDFGWDWERYAALVSLREASRSAAAVYLLGFERYRPVLRAAVLVSFLGYSSVIAGMMYELGLPWRIWHPIVMWNRHSVLFEVSLVRHALLHSARAGVLAGPR